ncbi:uncharacterized protein [Miscanthus floridulus]|uniref:uncharacterized protein n=1 Tax=Miscanthus floridulus TaxID=154761 RepID=UPI00345AA77D
MNTSASLASDFSPATGAGTLPMTDTPTMPAMSAIAAAPIWAFFFKSLCGKFGLRSHIDGSAPPRPDDHQWDAAECYVQGWIFGSFNDFVLDLAMDSADPTTRDLWVAIEGIFHANREPRTIFLLDDFHSMVHGDSTISAYYQQLKTKVATLRNVGHLIEDS